jgi:hypothetical protein
MVRIHKGSQPNTSSARAGHGSRWGSPRIWSSAYSLQPERQQDAAVLATVKARPGDEGAWREVGATAGFDGCLRATA